MPGIFRRRFDYALRQRRRPLVFPAFQLPHTAVDFNAADHMSRGAGLTGAVDYTQFALSFWIKTTSSTTSTLLTAWDASFNVYIHVQLNSSGTISLRLYDVSLTQLAILGSSAINDGAWHHVMFTYDSGAGDLGEAYVDGASVGGVDTCISGTVDGTSATNVRVGASSSGFNKINACVSNIWMGTGVSLPPSTSANLLKFRKADGTPENLGANGQTPTGTSPILYLRGDATGFPTNYGTGGDFSVTAGALADCVTTPWDVIPQFQMVV